MTKPSIMTDRILQRYLDQEPDRLDNAIMKLFEGHAIDWKTPPGLDRLDAGQKWKGLEHLREGGMIRKAWETAWPSDVEYPSWNLVARIRLGKSGCWEWLLLHAVSSFAELRGRCPVRSGTNHARIKQLMADAKTKVKAPSAADWLNGYYEYARHLAVRSFLTSQKSCGRMAFVFFTRPEDGEAMNNNDIPSLSEWEVELENAGQHLGLTGASAVECRIRRLFLPAGVTAHGRRNQKDVNEPTQEVKQLA